MLKTALFVLLLASSALASEPVTQVDGPASALGLSGEIDATTLDNHSSSFYLDRGNHTDAVDFALSQSNGVVFRTYTTAGVFLQWTGVTETAIIGNVFLNTSTDNATIGGGSGGHLNLLVDGSLLARPNIEVSIGVFVDDHLVSLSSRLDRRFGGAPSITPSFLNYSVPSSIANPLLNFTSIRYLQVAEGDYLTIGEDGGTPGAHFTAFFEGVDFPGSIRCRECAYDGSDLHDYETRAKNFVTDTWFDLRENEAGDDQSDFRNTPFSDASSLYYREFFFPDNFEDFVDSVGRVEVNFYHPQNGTTAHRFRADKLELVKRFSYSAIAFLVEGSFPPGSKIDVRLAVNKDGEKVGIKSLKLHGIRTSN